MPRSHDEVPLSPNDARTSSVDVFCVGLATLDIVHRTSEIPSASTKIFASSRREVGGGPASTAAVCVSRLGGRASFAGRLGLDPIGDRLKSELDHEAVDTTWLRQFEDVGSPSSTIIVDDEGERLIVAYSDPGMPADANWLTPRLERGVVLADLSWPQGAIAVLGAARDAGLPRVLDADRYRHDRALVDHVITLASHVIFSGPGLRQFTGQESVASGLAAIEGDFALIGVTDGSEGFFWRDGTRILRQKPPKIDVVDTTGAGDAFHGAFALSLSRGETIERAAAHATAVAAAKCRQPGARSGLPSLAQLDAFLADHTVPEIEG